MIESIKIKFADAEMKLISIIDTIIINKFTYKIISEENWNKPIKQNNSEDKSNDKFGKALGDFIFIVLHLS